MSKFKDKSIISVQWNVIIQNNINYLKLISSVGINEPFSFLYDTSIVRLFQRSNEIYFNYKIINNRILIYI